MSVRYPDQLATDTSNTRRGWQNWLALLLGIWLFVSPWVLAFGGGALTGNVTPVPPPEVNRAAWNAWVLGGIVFFVALAGAFNVTPAHYRQKLWNLILGAWIFAAPWALAFTALPRARWDHWIIGAAIFLVAAWDLWEARRMSAAVAPVSTMTGSTASDRASNLNPTADQSAEPLAQDPRMTPPVGNPPAEEPVGADQKRPETSVRDPR